MSGSIGSKWHMPTVGESISFTSAGIERRKQPPSSWTEVISSAAMRLELLRNMALAGVRIMNGVVVSSAWADRITGYARQGMFRREEHPHKKDVVRQTVHGYPEGIFERVKPEGRTFRVFRKTRRGMDSMVGEGHLLGGFASYYESSNGKRYRIKYEDLTGVFLTTPNTTNPAAVGVPNYEYYADLTIPEDVGLIKIAFYDIYIAPGLARFDDRTLLAGLNILAGRQERSATSSDIVELLDLFGGPPPDFSIPIDVQEVTDLTSKRSFGGICEDSQSVLAEITSIDWTHSETYASDVLISQAAIDASFAASISMSLFGPAMA